VGERRLLTRVGGVVGAVGFTATVRVGDGLARDRASVGYFVTGRRLQAGGPYSLRPDRGRRIGQCRVRSNIS
jgi:hypothetical protein